MGDPVSMAITHAHASGMGGMRGAGDLVARAQMTKGMRIQEAKDYVAGAPVTPRWAARIGADGYAEDAQDGIVKIKEMLN